MQKDLEAKAAQLEAQLSLRVENSKAELERVVNEKSEVHLNRLLSEASDLRNQVASTDSKVVNLNEAVGLLDASLKTSVNVTRQLISETAAELREVEEHIWDLKGNTLEYTYHPEPRKFRAARDAANSVLVRSILSRMKEAIGRHYISKNRALRPPIKELIEMNIAGAKEIDSILVTEVLDLLGRVRTEG